MKRASVILRDQPVYRRDAVVSGLSRLGYAVDTTGSVKCDLLVTWNRYGRFDNAAIQAQKQGADVIVMENGYFGRDEPGGPWYSVGREHHNSTPITIGERDRIRMMPVQVQPWREGGKEIVILAQRGIGEEGIRQPNGWPSKAAEQLRKVTDRPIRIRPHPGKAEVKPLLDDLRDAWAVCTWASGAGIKALAAGIPVIYGYRHWIAAMGGIHLDAWDGRLPRGDRDAALNRCAWGTWSVDEISQGTPFRYL